MITVQPDDNDVYVESEEESYPPPEYETPEEDRAPFPESDASPMSVSETLLLPAPPSSQHELPVLQLPANQPILQLGPPPMM